MQDALLLARDIAPKDTGNLAFNAISVMPTHNGFRVYYDGSRAFYLQYLQEGTRYSKRHQGFIDLTSTAISAHITAYLNGHINNLNATRDRLAEYANTPDRDTRLDQSLGRTRGQKEELITYSLTGTMRRG